MSPSSEHGISGGSPGAGSGAREVAPQVIAVVGATATGKSDLGIALAAELDGEVINADASQLYRGMDIGTAKVPLPERQGVAHHQLDVLEITQDGSVAAYQRHARGDLDAILGRGRLPVVVGGSGLYVRALLDQLDIPPTDPEVRARLEERAAVEGLGSLYDELRRADPAAAQVIDSRNGRRIIRALEVISLTGRPFSASMPTREFVRPTVMIGLRADRAMLDARIEARVLRMWEQGFVDEVALLLSAGLRDTRTAGRAVGYPQVIDYLDGRASRSEAIEATVAATRRLVRRQESWLGPDSRIVWLEAQPGVERLASRIVRGAGLS